MNGVELRMARTCVHRRWNGRVRRQRRGVRHIAVKQMPCRHIGASSFAYALLVFEAVHRRVPLPAAMPSKRTVLGASVRACHSSPSNQPINQSLPPFTEQLLFDVLLRIRGCPRCCVALPRTLAWQLASHQCTCTLNQRKQNSCQSLMALVECTRAALHPAVAAEALHRHHRQCRRLCPFNTAAACAQHTRPPCMALSAPRARGRCR